MLQIEGMKQLPKPMPTMATVNFPIFHKLLLKVSDLLFSFFIFFCISMWRYSTSEILIRQRCGGSSALIISSFTMNHQGIFCKRGTRQIDFRPEVPCFQNCSHLFREAVFLPVQVEHRQGQHMMIIDGGNDFKVFTPSTVIAFRWHAGRAAQRPDRLLPARWAIRMHLHGASLTGSK